MSKIAIVDDDQESSENLGAFLKDKGFDVVVETDVDVAVSTLVKNRPDLLVLDLMFPADDAGGFKIAVEIRRTPEIKNLPIIMLTNVNQEFPASFSVRDIDPKWMPIQDFVEKPVNPAKLVEKINKLLKR